MCLERGNYCSREALPTAAALAAAATAAAAAAEFATIEFARQKIHYKEAA